MKEPERGRASQTKEREWRNAEDQKIKNSEHERSTKTELYCSESEEKTK